MRKELTVETKQRNWSLATDITYATVRSWYGATYRSMKCSVCRPKVQKDEQMPLLIWLCGGAFKVMDKDVWWPQWIDFAKKGCVVASVEYRTSNEETFPAALCDVKAAIRYFKAHAAEYGIDAERIFVAGESAGGALASLAGVTGKKENGIYDVGEWMEENSSVRGVIDYYGVVDMRTQGVRTEGNATYGAEEQFLGIEVDRKWQQEQASAISHVSSETPPFLIFHGDQDPLVDIAQSEELYRKLCEAGVEADYYVLKGEGHGSDAFYQDEVMEIVREFIQRECR